MLNISEPNTPNRLPSAKGTKWLVIVAAVMVAIVAAAAAAGSVVYVIQQNSINRLQASNSQLETQLSSSISNLTGLQQQHNSDQTIISNDQNIVNGLENVIANDGNGISAGSETIVSPVTTTLGPDDTMTLQDFNATYAGYIAIAFTSTIGIAWTVSNSTYQSTLPITETTGSTSFTYVFPVSPGIISIEMSNPTPISTTVNYTIVDYY